MTLTSVVIALNGEKSMTTRIFKVYGYHNVDLDGSFTETFTIDKSKTNSDGSYDYNIVTVLCTDVAPCRLDHNYLTVVITRNTFEECITAFEELCTQGPLKDLHFWKYMIISGGAEGQILNPHKATNKCLISLKRLKKEEIKKLFMSDFCCYANQWALRFNLAPLFAIYPDAPFGKEKWHVIKNSKVLESTEECLEVIKETEKQDLTYRGFLDNLTCD